MVSIYVVVPHFIGQSKIDAAGGIDYHFVPGDYVCYGNFGACIIVRSYSNPQPESPREGNEIVYECIQLFYDKDEGKMHTSVSTCSRNFIAKYNHARRNLYISKYVQEMFKTFNSLSEMIFYLRLMEVSPDLDFSHEQKSAT